MPTTSSNIPDGTYAVQHKGTGKYVTAYESGKPGDQLYVYSDPGSPYSDQQFSFKRQNDNTYIITCVNHGRAVDVAGTGTTNGTQIVQWEYSGGSNQRWFIVDVGDGYYRFVPKHTNMSMDVCENGVGNNTKIQLWTHNFSDAQKFRLISIQASAPTLSSISIAAIPSKTGYIQNDVWMMANLHRVKR